MQEIPIFNTVSSSFTQSISLGSRLFTVGIKWNPRSTAWLMSLTDGGSTILNIKIVPNWLLLRQYKYKLPELDGDIICLQVDEDAPERIDYNSLGVSYKLFYATSEESESWENFYGVG